MLPPVLEIYVAWHPKDQAGAQIAKDLVAHFHGSEFSGLMGGAIEVYTRSAGWRTADDAPRPIPFDERSLPGGLRRAEFVVVVPILGVELAAAIEKGPGPWRDYVEAMVAARKAAPERIGIFPCVLHRAAMDRTALYELLGKLQAIAALDAAGAATEYPSSVRCRDLAQSIAQLLSVDRQRLTVFVSHTKRKAPNSEEPIGKLIEAVRNVILGTRLEDFFDAQDLQSGEDWDDELRDKAQTCALLAIRTDLYASRDWCQREVRIAKGAGVPVVIMDALTNGEERGSFLMDHVPRVPARNSSGEWDKGDIRRALNRLVDVCLKRELWRQQEMLAQGKLELMVAWWAPHAPEPITFAKWLLEAQAGKKLPAQGDDLVILHPDPPLGAEEMSALQDILKLGGLSYTLDVMTPRMLATRGA